MDVIKMTPLVAITNKSHTTSLDKSAKTKRCSVRWPTQCICVGEIKLQQFLLRLQQNCMQAKNKKKNHWEGVFEFPQIRSCNFHAAHSPVELCLHTGHRFAQSLFAFYHETKRIKRWDYRHSDLLWMNTCSDVWQAFHSLRAEWLLCFSLVPFPDMIYITQDQCWYTQKCIDYITKFAIINLGVIY